MLASLEQAVGSAKSFYINPQLYAPSHQQSYQAVQSTSPTYDYHGSIAKADGGIFLGVLIGAYVFNRIATALIGGSKPSKSDNAPADDTTPVDSSQDTASNDSGGYSGDSSGSGD